MAHRAAPIVPTIFSEQPITNIITAIGKGSIINPQIKHISLEYLCAKIQASLFFIEIEVLYLNIVLIFLGAVFEKYLPKHIIIEKFFDTHLKV